MVFTLVWQYRQWILLQCAGSAGGGVYSGWNSYKYNKSGMVDAQTHIQKSFSDRNNGMRLKHGDSDRNIPGIVRIAEVQDRHNKDPMLNNYSLYTRCIEGKDLVKYAEVPVPSHNWNSAHRYTFEPYVISDYQCKYSNESNICQGES